MEKEKLEFFFRYTYRTGQNFLDVANHANTSDKTIGHLELLLENLFAAIPFDFNLIGDVQIDFLRRNRDKSIPLELEIKDRFKYSLLLEIKIVPKVSMNQALSTLNLKGFMRSGYWPGKLYPGMYGDEFDPIFNI